MPLRRGVVMRIPRSALGLLVILAGAGLLSGGAAAQGFFESLFGVGSSAKASKPKPASSGPSTRPVPSVRSLNRSSPYGSGRWSTSEEEDNPDLYTTEEAQMGGYRTMCVRLCDGYYWPIRSSASESQFNADAKLCAKSCDCEAKLFYLPRSSSDISQMTDLSGKSYGSLETAFKYRKTLTKSCACKPAPWSEAEVTRHRVYAIVGIMKAQEQRIAAEKKAAEDAMAKAEEKRREDEAKLASGGAPEQPETASAEGPPAAAPEGSGNAVPISSVTEGAFETASVSASALVPMDDVPAAPKLFRPPQSAKRWRPPAARTAARSQRVASEHGVFSGFNPGSPW